LPDVLRQISSRLIEHGWFVVGGPDDKILA
jgi:hypothetical protein